MSVVSPHVCMLQYKTVCVLETFTPGVTWWNDVILSASSAVNIDTKSPVRMLLIVPFIFDVHFANF